MLLTWLSFFLFFFWKNQTIKEKRSDEVVREKTSEDGKIVLDIIEAIHAAEKKQADVDAYMYSEERRKLKVCYSFTFFFCLSMVFICWGYKVQH